MYSAFGTVEKEPAVTDRRKVPERTVPVDTTDRRKVSERTVPVDTPVDTKRALQNKCRMPVPILKGSFLKGGNDKQYFDREEIFLRGELFLTSLSMMSS